MKDEDLPWAVLMLPCTAGSGLANAVQGCQVKPGDRVIGFFLDGDDGQQPVVVNVFPVQKQVAGVTGFNGLDPASPKLENKETNEPTIDSAPTPVHLPIDIAYGKNRISAYEGIGDIVPLANNTQNSKINKVK